MYIVCMHKYVQHELYTHYLAHMYMSACICIICMCTHILAAQLRVAGSGIKALWLCVTCI